MTSRFSRLTTGQAGTVADRRVCESKRRFVPEAGSRDACQKLSPMRTCSGSFSARIVVRLCGYGFAMHPGCSVSCTGVDRFGWWAHWDGLYRYTMDDGRAPVAKPTGKTKIPVSQRSGAYRAPGC